jgi:transcriptional regulator with XRE-family HTH domain
MQKRPSPSRGHALQSVPINGCLVREMRLLADESQGEVAKRAKISAVYLSAIETGKRPTVSRRVFARLCQALGVDDPRTLAPKEAQEAAA